MKTGASMNSSSSENSMIWPEHPQRLVAGETEQRGVVEDVLAPRKHRIETDAELRDRRQPATQHDTAPVGVEPALDELQQRALARTVGTDDPQAFAGRERQRDVRERPELAVPQRPRRGTAADQRARDVPQTVAQRLLEIAAVLLRHRLDGDQRWRAQGFAAFTAGILVCAPDGSGRGVLPPGRR